jgi:site-specific recombinase XerD
MATSELRVIGKGAESRIDTVGDDALLCNEFLAYVADRRYSPASVRAYAFDLLHFLGWLEAEELCLDDVDADALVRYLAACRRPRRPAEPDNVVPLRGGRNVGLAPATVNRRLAAISGLFSFRELRDPSRLNPVPRGPAAHRSAKGARTGLLGHLDRPRPRSKLRVKEPRRLPRGLDRGEITALFASFRSDRDRAIAGLMLFSGLRSAEVLGLEVRDVDVGGGWAGVVGKGDKERRVPIDPDVASLIQSYLLAERPETSSHALFV